MTCILYKDGQEERVKAEYVEHMLRHGYSATKNEKPKEAEVNPSLQADLALDSVKNSKKTTKRVVSNADKDKG